MILAQNFQKVCILRFARGMTAVSEFHSRETVRFNVQWLPVNVVLLFFKMNARAR